jgi:two-component system, sensor histidine kinase LadS
MGLVRGGLTTIWTWLTAIALAAVLGGCVWTQESALENTGVPIPAPLKLSGEQHSITLDKRSRFWIGDANQRTPDLLEAEGNNIDWGLRDARQSYDIDGKVLWIQFDAVLRNQQRWFLEIGASGVDRAQLFYRGPGGQWVVQEAGDSRPVSEWPVPGRLPTFELSGSTDWPVRYWLRVEQDRVDFGSPLVVVDQSTLLTSREQEQFLLGGYFSVAMLIAVISAAQAIAFRDRNFAAYSIYVIALAAGQLAYLGVGAQHAWDGWLQWNEMAVFVLPGISGAAALWFTKVVTEPARFSRALDLTVWALIAALLSAVALDAHLASRQSIQLVVALTTVALIVIAALIALVWSHGDDSNVGLIALGFLPVVVLAVFPLARGLNLIPISAATRYGVPAGAALQMPILYYALLMRGSRRREAHSRVAGLARHDTLTGLAHTRAFLQRLEGSLARCADLKHTCALLGVKILNYETITAEFGRDTAERALVVATALLRSVSRDMDAVARVGDHEFALLIEGPTTPQEATGRAQQLVASGLRDSASLPPGLLLKFQVAVALLPDQNLDSEGSLNWVLDALNSNWPDARKLIRAINF